MPDTTPDAAESASFRASLAPDRVGGLTEIPLYKGSGRRGSNSRPSAWEGAGDVSPVVPASPLVSTESDDLGVPGGLRASASWDGEGQGVRHFLRHLGAA